MKKKLNYNNPNNKFVGDNIVASTSDWKFSGETVVNFDTHIKKSIPLYEWSHEVSLKLSDFFLHEKTNIYDLGCSTGIFLKSLSLRSSSQKHTYYGLDEINEMCKVAKKNNLKNNRVKILNKSIVDFNFKETSFITSFYTMQFINPSKRQKIIDKIYKSLNWGGAFIIFEKVRAPDARFQDMIMQIYNEYKLDQGFSCQEIINKSMSLKGVMEPHSSAANFQMLRRSGFRDIITVLKFLNFEGFLAIK